MRLNEEDDTPTSRMLAQKNSDRQTNEQVRLTHIRAATTTHKEMSIPTSQLAYSNAINTRRHKGTKTQRTSRRDNEPIKQ